MEPALVKTGAGVQEFQGQWNPAYAGMTLWDTWNTKNRL